MNTTCRSRCARASKPNVRRSTSRRSGGSADTGTEHPGRGAICKRLGLAPESVLRRALLMGGRLLPGTAVRVRRGQRRDLPGMEAVLGSGGGVDARTARFRRRVLRDPRGDVYVAEDAGGEIVGVVALVYARSLVRGGLSAVLDGARSRQTPARPLLER